MYLTPTEANQYLFQPAGVTATSMDRPAIASTSSTTIPCTTTSSSMYPEAQVMTVTQGVSTSVIERQSDDKISITITKGDKVVRIDM